MKGILEGEFGLILVEQHKETEKLAVCEYSSFEFVSNGDPLNKLIRLPTIWYYLNFPIIQQTSSEAKLQESGFHKKYTLWVCI